MRALRLAPSRSTLLAAVDRRRRERLCGEYGPDVGRSHAIVAFSRELGTGFSRAVSAPALRATSAS
jgi:hypothetical protein